MFGTDTTNAFTADGGDVYVKLEQVAENADTFEDSGGLKIETLNEFILTDEAGNTNSDLKPQTQAAVSDGAAPSIKAFVYEDSDNNGRIDQFRIFFSEEVTEASSLAAKDLILINSGDFTGAAFGVDGYDLVTEPTTSVVVPLDSESTVLDIKEDSGSLMISTQGTFVLSDGSNINSYEGAQRQTIFTDSASELSIDQMVESNYEDIVLTTDNAEEAPEDLSAPTESTTEFHDIYGHWAEAYISEIAAREIVSGKQNGSFAPNDLMTRAELTKVAILAFDIPMPEVVDPYSFVDIRPEMWYSHYVYTAKENGIVQGDGDRFNPNDPITRAEVLKILIEAAGFNNVNENFNANYTSKSGWSYVFFPDVLIGQWYARYVAYAKDFDIVGGYDDGTFRPSNSVTRAEVAKIVTKVLDLTEGVL